MSSMTFLSWLNLSNNNLTGKIPSSTQLQQKLYLVASIYARYTIYLLQLPSLYASSFFGNRLCGPPLIDNCTIIDVKPNIGNKRSEDFWGLEVDWFYMSMALGFIVGFWVVLDTLLLKKQWRIIYFQFLYRFG